MYRSIGGKVIKRFEITKYFSAFNTSLTYQQKAPQTILSLRGMKAGVEVFIDLHPFSDRGHPRSLQEGIRCRD